MFAANRKDQFCFDLPSSIRRRKPVSQPAIPARKSSIAVLSSRLFFNLAEFVVLLLTDGRRNVRTESSRQIPLGVSPDESGSPCPAYLLEWVITGAIIGVSASDDTGDHVPQVTPMLTDHSTVPRRSLSVIASCAVLLPCVFARPSFGDLLAWATGDEGTIINTVNFASSWVPEVSGTTENLYAAQFVDPVNGWAFGGSGTIRHTSDGGVNWTAQTSGTSQTLFSGFFVDLQSGWAVGGGTIIHTSDGGAIWTDQSMDIPVDLLDVQFVDPLMGWAVGRDGVLLHNTGVMWMPELSGTSEDLFGVEFLDAQTGWAVGAGGVIRHTSDGNTWSAQTSHTLETLEDITFLHQSGWIVGTGGTILHTIDGGTTWVAEDSGVSTDLFHVWFVDTHNGLAVGEGGMILRTIDGGDTWMPQVSGTTARLFSVCMFVTATGELFGDYNHNGTVDAADYVAWRQGASPNPNSNVDYNTWRAYFGATASSDGGAAGDAFVPEPTMLMLVIFAAGNCVGFRPNVWRLSTTRP